jgi:hypothetical protein
MDRLYPALASISRAVDLIVTLHLLSSAYFLIVVILVSVIANRLTTLSRQHAAMLIQSSNWVQFEDCKFRLLPNGRAEFISVDGLRTLWSVKHLERMLRKQSKARGTAFDDAAFTRIIEDRSAR